MLCQCQDIFDQWYLSALKLVIFHSERSKSDVTPQYQLPLYFPLFAALYLISSVTEAYNFFYSCIKQILIAYKILGSDSQRRKRHCT